MKDTEILTGNGSDSRRAHLQRTVESTGVAVQTTQHIGVGVSNLADILMGTQTKVDKMMAEVAERLSAVAAKATFREKIVITADTIVIEREVSMAKDRQY